MQALDVQCKPVHFAISYPQCTPQALAVPPRACTMLLPHVLPTVHPASQAIAVQCISRMHNVAAARVWAPARNVGTVARDSTVALAKCEGGRRGQENSRPRAKHNRPWHRTRLVPVIQHIVRHRQDHAEQTAASHGSLSACDHSARRAVHPLRWTARPPARRAPNSAQRAVTPDGSARSEGRFRGCRHCCPVHLAHAQCCCRTCVGPSA